MRAQLLLRCPEPVPTGALARPRPCAEVGWQVHLEGSTLCGSSCARQLALRLSLPAVLLLLQAPGPSRQELTP